MSDVSAKRDHNHLWNVIRLLPPQVAAGEDATALVSLVFILAISSLDWQQWLMSMLTSRDHHHWGHHRWDRHHDRLH